MKTIKDAAKSANAYGYPNYTGANNEAFDSGFKSGVEFIQRWIPIEEETPEEDHAPDAQRHHQIPRRQREDHRS